MPFEFGMHIACGAKMMAFKWPLDSFGKVEMLIHTCYNGYQIGLDAAYSNLLVSLISYRCVTPWVRSFALVWV